MAETADQPGALFTVPCWKYFLSDMTRFHAEMAQDVTESLERDAALPDSDRFLAHQTRSDPFLLPSDGWKLLAEHINGRFAAILAQNLQRWRDGEFHLRRWAIRLGRLSREEKDRLRDHGVHNHTPALLSCIYYLQIPDELADRPEGGTNFINPLTSNLDLLMPRSVTLPPKEGMLFIFPSFIDHSPVPVEWDAVDSPRIVLSCDAYFINGRSSSSSDRVSVVPSSA